MTLFYLLFNFMLDLLHLAVVFFNLFGITLLKTRKAHFLLINLTAFSWGILGYFYGWGYCFLTDFHWHIKEKLLYENLPSSYITYILSWFSLSPDENLIDTLTGAIFLFLFTLSWVFYIKDFRWKKNIP